MKIRRANLGDLDAAEAVAPLFHAEAPPAYRAMPLSLKKVRASLTAMIKTGIFIVAENDAGRPVGFAGAVCGSAWFSDSPMTLECFWWVYPEYRGSLCAPRLFAALKKAAAGTDLVMLTLEGDNAGGLQTFYERAGAVLFERAYILKV